MIDINNLKKLHFIGIGGVGMSPLAKMLIESGYEVTGSDCSDSANVKMLKNMGTKIFIGQDGKNLLNSDGSPSCDAVVYSSAIPKTNPEIVKAEELKIPILHRADINAFFVNNKKKGIAVAGSHGKTTTTSMIGFILHEAGIDPSFIIGGISTDLGTSALLGNSEYLVSEADESDGTFLKLKPAIEVITNVEDDHLDYYGTIEKIQEAFKNFLENLNKDTGLAILCYDNEPLRTMGNKINRKVISYGIDNEADFMANNIKTSVEGISFDVYKKGKNIGKIQLALHGKHNVLNSLAAIILALEAGVKFDKIAEALSKFHGAKRRFQTKGNLKKIWVVDDYGHHPSEIEATLKAAKETNRKRVICIFQPHRYSRTKLLLKKFGTAFYDADVLILTDVYSAGEKPIEGIDGESIVKEVKENKKNKEVFYVKEREKIAQFLIDKLKEDDLVITMGAGDNYKTGEELIELLKK